LGTFPQQELFYHSYCKYARDWCTSW